MYDVTESTSLHCLGVWLEESRRYCGNAKLFLVGNKIDCTASEVEVQPETAQHFAEKHKIKSGHIFQISVKTGKGFSAFLSELAKILDKTMEPSVRDNTAAKFVDDEEEKKPCRCWTKNLDLKYFIIRKSRILTVGLVFHTEKNLAVIQKSDLQNKFFLYHEGNGITFTQLTFAFSKSAIETLEKGVKYVQS